jgi:hypothetical protein
LLFDRYLFADYSGAGENHRAQSGIRLYRILGEGAPVRLFPNSVGQRWPLNFSRNRLRQRLLQELDDVPLAWHPQILREGWILGMDASALDAPDSLAK